MLRDPCSILCVSKLASKNEIRSAYLRLVRQHHPDRFSDISKKREAEEFLKIINQAYEEALLSTQQCSSSEKAVADPRHKKHSVKSELTRFKGRENSTNKPFWPNILFVLFLVFAWMTFARISPISSSSVFLYFAAFAVIPSITAFWYNITKGNIPGAKLSFVGATSLASLFVIMQIVMSQQSRVPELLIDTKTGGAISNGYEAGSGVARDPYTIENNVFDRDRSITSPSVKPTSAPVEPSVPLVPFAPVVPSASPAR